jgi:hypothetical protein
MAQELYIPSMDGIIQTVNTSLGNVFQDNRDASFNNVDISGILKSSNTSNTINFSSHLIPSSNDSFDIGSAEYKVRDLYVSNNSIFIGDVNKLDIDTNGSLVLRKRKTNIVPSGLFEDLTNSDLGFDKTNNGAILDDINDKLGLNTSITNFSQMKLENWKSYSDKIRNNANKIKKEVNELFKPTESNDWEEEKKLSGLITDYNNANFNNISISGNIIPVNDNEISLGTSTKSFKDVYIGPGSLYVNGKKVIEDDSTSMVFKTDNNQNLTIQTTGTSGLLKFNSDYNITLDPSGSIDLISSKLNFKDNITLDTINNDAINIDCRLNIKSDLYLQSNSIDSYLYTGSNFIIDPYQHNDDRGKVIIKGDLEVQGSTTTIHSTTLDICDNRIKLNATTSSDAGIDISFNDGTSKSFYYDKSNSKWKTDNTSLDIGSGQLTSGDLTVNGNVSFNSNIDFNGKISLNNNYGTANQVLVSNGSNSAVSWENQISYTGGTGVSINGSNEISIGQNVATNSNITFNSIRSDYNYSSDYRTIEKSGVMNAYSGQWTTIATFMQNQTTNTWRSAEIIIEEAHSPTNGGDKGGGIWVGNFTYNFNNNGGRTVSIGSFTRISGHGGSITFRFVALSNNNALSGARLEVYNYREITNFLKYKFKFHALDAFTLS